LDRVPLGERRVQLIDHLEPRCAELGLAGTDPRYDRRVGIAIR
jgi:hypothetical protein